MPREKSAEGECTRPSTRAGRAKTILFVDDEPLILADRRLVFEDLGYSVHTAGCGAEALDLLQKLDVDAVVLDYLMSPMNGEETARNIRRLHGNVRIVLSSGCVSLPQSVFDVVDTLVEKGMGVRILVETLQRLLSLDENP